MWGARRKPSDVAELYDIRRRRCQLFRLVVAAHRRAAGHGASAELPMIAVMINI